MTLQAKQREQREFEQRAARIQKLEARQKQEEAAAVKALGQQLLAHQVSLPSHQSPATLLCHPAGETYVHKVGMMSPFHSSSWCLTCAISEGAVTLLYWQTESAHISQTPAPLSASALCSVHSGCSSRLSVCVCVCVSVCLSVCLSAVSVASFCQLCMVSSSFLLFDVCPKVHNQVRCNTLLTTLSP